MLYDRLLCLQRWHFVHRGFHNLHPPLMPHPSPNFSSLLASRAKSHGRRNMIRRKGTKNTFNDFMWRRQQNTPRNWQLDNFFYYPFVLLLLYFYSGESVGAAVTAFQLNRRLLGQRHGGRLNKARSLFAFYWFDQSLHGEDLSYLFVFHHLFLYTHNRALAFGELAERCFGLHQSERKNKQTNKQKEAAVI